MTRECHVRFCESAGVRSPRATHLVICCRPGNGEAALATMRHLMTRLGLTVNEAKTRLIRIPDGSCDFLGYTIGRFHGRDGGAYIGTRPSRKAVRALLRKIHDATTPQRHADTPEHRVAEISSLLRGWAGYFNQGPVTRIYETARRYTERRVRRWLMRRRGQKGTGYRQYPDEYLYQKLGLYPCRADVPTRRARRLDVSGESRMQEICTSGLMSGDWKRSHGQE